MLGLEHTYTFKTHIFPLRLKKSSVHTAFILQHISVNTGMPEWFQMLQQACQVSR